MMLKTNLSECVLRCLDVRFGKTEMTFITVRLGP